MNKKGKELNMEASFFQRLGAYIIDTLIIGIIASIICYSLPISDSSMEEQISSLSEKYVSGEITMNDFYGEYNDLLYQQQKETLLETGITLILTVGYFVVFQYMNKGQTLGKKLLNIKVVDSNGKPPTIVKGLIRSLIVLGIASTIIDLILINIITKKAYIPCYLIISIIETIFIVITAICVLYRKDRRGLHDMMANTNVIREGR